VVQAGAELRAGPQPAIAGDLKEQDRTATEACNYKVTELNVARSSALLSQYCKTTGPRQSANQFYAPRTDTQKRLWDVAEGALLLAVD
jgi:hypothetical protein